MGDVRVRAQMGRFTAAKLDVAVKPLRRARHDAHVREPTVAPINGTPQASSTL